MILTQENYYSKEADWAFMSYSQFTSFSKCEARTMAKLRGEYVEETGTALLQGSYLDAYVEGTLDEFIEANPEMVSSRGATKGQLKAEFRKLDEVIERFSRDEYFMSYLEGEKQIILTGKIAGVDYKCKVDILAKDKIVDFKGIADFKEQWADDFSEKVSYAEKWGYLYQASIYQELVRQNYGIELPFFHAVATKEKSPDIAIVSFPQDILDAKLAEVEHRTSSFDAIKKGLAEPERCGHCDYCKATRILTAPIDYRDVAYMQE